MSLIIRAVLVGSLVAVISLFALMFGNDNALAFTQIQHQAAKVFSVAGMMVGVPCFLAFLLLSKRDDGILGTLTCCGALTCSVGLGISTAILGFVGTGIVITLIAAVLGLLAWQSARSWVVGASWVGVYLILPFGTMIGHQVAHPGQYLVPAFIFVGIAIALSFALAEIGPILRDEDTVPAAA